MNHCEYVSESKKSYWKLVFGLCVFIWLLSFKPSEPYLSQFLICNQSTELATCNKIELQNDCISPCIWDFTNPIPSCSALTSCGSITSAGECSSTPYSNYCDWQSVSASCHSSVCYKQFTEDQVNNDIYPWSTYAYLPFLCLLGPFAEIHSYRIAILFGISGRVATRFLLIYGQSLLSQQLMQVVYSMGTAAEDGKVFVISKIRILDNPKCRSMFLGLPSIQCLYLLRGSPQVLHRCNCICKGQCTDCVCFVGGPR